MKYSSFFSQSLKGNGIPHLNEDQFSRYFNIIHLEGKLSGLKKVFDKTGQKDLLMQFRIEKQLTELTGNLEPKLLLEEMLYNSKL